MFSPELMKAAQDTLHVFSVKQKKIVTAESCTGGLIAAVLTEIPGSSSVVDRAFVTYSNAAKSACLDVSASLIAVHGAVSRPVALAMAAGALANSDADVAVAVTGIAGPGGGTLEKPVGLVHIAAISRGGATSHHECQFGDIGRTFIRIESAIAALTSASEMLNR